jgi:hypothetical protein
MLRFAGLDEEEVEVVVAPTEVGGGPPLPASWREKGLEIPTPAAGLEDARRLAFAAGTGRSIADWEDILRMRRGKMGLTGDHGRTFQWSIQDFYVIAAVTLSNVLFVHPRPDGSLQIDTWIQPPTPAGFKVSNAMFMIFWGPRQLLVTKGKMYRFYGRDVPTDLLEELDGKSPIPDEEARGSIDAEAGGETEGAPVSSPEAAVSSPEAPVSSDLPVLEPVGAQLPPPQAAANLESMEGMPPPPAPAPTLEGVPAPGPYENID